MFNTPHPVTQQPTTPLSLIETAETWLSQAQAIIELIEMGMDGTRPADVAIGAIADLVTRSLTHLGEAEKALVGAPRNA